MELGTNAREGTQINPCFLSRPVVPTPLDTHIHTHVHTQTHTHSSGLLPCSRLVHLILHQVNPLMLPGAGCCRKVHQSWGVSQARLVQLWISTNRSLGMWHGAGKRTLDLGVGVSQP